MTRIVRHRGFTLLETLLALTMAAVLVTSLYVALSAATAARGRAIEAMEPARSVELLFDTIRDDLRSVLAPGGILGRDFLGENDRLSTGSDGDRLLFVTAERPPADDPAAVIRQIELTMENPDGGEPALRRRVTSRLLATVTPEPVEQLLSRDVTGLNLRYWDGGAWQDSWNSAAQDAPVPAAVEITLFLRSRGVVASMQPGITTDPPVRRVIMLSTATTAASDTTGVVR